RSHRPVEYRPFAYEDQVTSLLCTSLQSNTPFHED
ncbi:unnamed protein product, partial [Gulo gulo]